ncbi:hypothetical protein C8Q79DRAFT_1013084 [Trametes meyenii]|nr:hypothetical protein C8Q79DRAFT_1013084 [Trametes meyenii]
MLDPQDWMISYTELYASTESSTSQTSSISDYHGPLSKPSRTGVWDVPVTLSETGGQTFGFDAKDAKARNIRLGKEMQDFVVGPMPVEMFLEKYFNASTISLKGIPPWENAFDKVPNGKKPRKKTKKGEKEGKGGEKEKPLQEKDIYELVIRAMNATAGRGSRCPGFSFRNTSDNPDKSRGVVGCRKPDICCYADHHLSQVETPSSSGDLRAQADMGFAEMYFEVKLKASQDVFRDPPPDTTTQYRRDWHFCFHGRKSETALRDAMEVLGQNSTYAAEIFMQQYRLCVYSVSMSSTIVRILRWDRAGVIVTEAFDIHKRPDFLCKFFWYLAHSSDTVRGYDLSVVPATTEEETKFANQIKQHIATQISVVGEDAMQHALDEHFALGHVTSVFMPRLAPDQNTEIIYRLLVSRPLSVPLSVVGRSTRTYWAVDPDASAVVFLKDTWRLGRSDREGRD